MRLVSDYLEADRSTITHVMIGGGVLRPLLSMG